MGTNGWDRWDRWMRALHFRSGYEPYFAALAWAVIVDVTTTSTVTWVISGIYLWARKPRKRLMGGLCLIAGILLFITLAVLLCCSTESSSSCTAHGVKTWRL